MQLDDRRISALFDTGAQFSVLSTRAALALGVSETALARDPAVMLRGADGEQLSAHAHRFFRLEVDGEVVRNAEIDVTGISLNDADFQGRSASCHSGSAALGCEGSARDRRRRSPVR